MRDPRSKRCDLPISSNTTSACFQRASSRDAVDIVFLVVVEYRAVNSGEGEISAVAPLFCELQFCVSGLGAKWCKA